MSARATRILSHRKTDESPWWRASCDPVRSLAETQDDVEVSRERVRQIEHGMCEKFLLAFTGCTFADVERQIELGLTDNGRSLAGVWLDDFIRDAMGGASC